MFVSSEVPLLCSTGFELLIGSLTETQLHRTIHYQ